MEIETKKCTKCGEDKIIDEFRFIRVRNKNRPDCKECEKNYRDANKENSKIYRNLRKDKTKKYNKKYNNENKEKIKIYNKEYKGNNKEKTKIYNKEYKENNKEKEKEYSKIHGKIYRKENKEKLRERKRIYAKNRRKTDPVYKYSCAIRSSIRGAFKYSGHIKTCKTAEILGCSFAEFKIYIEKQFEPWMNLANHGKYNGKPNFGWDFDHIECLFPKGVKRTKEDIIKLNHYTNFRPFCSYANRDIKKNNI